MQNNIDDWFMSAIPPPELQVQFPGLKAVRIREFDLLKLGHSVKQLPEALSDSRVINVSQSLQRAQETESSSTTITTTWRAFDTNKCRLLLGVEAALIK